MIPRKIIIPENLAEGCSLLPEENGQVLDDKREAEGKSEWDRKKPSTVVPSRTEIYLAYGIIPET